MHKFEISSSMASSLLLLFFFHLSRSLKSKRIFQDGRFSFVIFLMLFFFRLSCVSVWWITYNWNEHFVSIDCCITNRKMSNEDAKQEHSQWNYTHSIRCIETFSHINEISHRAPSFEKEKKWRQLLFNAFKTIFQAFLILWVCFFLSMLMEIHQIYKFGL